MQVVVAEKPSVARDIARVLGAGTRRDGYLQGGGYAVTWALGHLVALPEPHEVDARWKRWRVEHLPMLPRHWPLSVIERTAAQFRVVQRLLKDERTRTVVCATDAGREGELIFRHIMERAGCTSPVKRLWISSLTPAAIRNGFERLRDGTEFDRLAAAAQARSRADWLVGMNLSRAYTLSMDDTLSVGRVQTPTLAMLVARDREIRQFVPEDYLEVWVKLPCDPALPDPPCERFEARYVGSGVEARLLAGSKTSTRPARLPADGELAQQLLQRLTKGELGVVRVDVVPRRLRPSLLYDLTELQRHANRLFGWSAQRTLELAQQLYEKHKLISYPRTDCRHLSGALETQLPAIVARIAPAYAGGLPATLAHRLGQGELGTRFVDDRRVTDHHAIIPTDRPCSLSPQGDLHKLYDLVCRRLLQAYLPDYQYTDTTLWLERPAGPEHDNDLFRARGQVAKEEGFRRLDRPTARRSRPARGAQAAAPPLPDLAVGQRLPVMEAGVDKRQTQPPRPYDDASLLTAMETAGRAVDDRALSDAMRERGLGTPATRSAIIENLLGRGYVERDKKQLRSTDKGERLIDSVHEQVRSPAMTGEWEHKLKAIERGEGDLEQFLAAIERYVQEVVNAVVADAPPRPCAARPAAVAAGGPSQRLPAATRPPPSSSPPALVSLKPRAARPQVAHGPAALESNLRSVFGHDNFRPNQQDVCKRIVAGENVLLVMPTGAGKSLCYQLPGLVREGATLVISPLIALMDDQVGKLQTLGLRAQSIHSGRDRSHSRQVCRAYLDGELDFLFVAPERLRVPGFCEMLARRQLGLIAIDEAHCISQWGHDFRPDYRMLQQRLPQLGKTPIVALTATATGQVQSDILEQLGIEDAYRAVHGFRRGNLAVEIVQMTAGARAAALQCLLTDPARLPAIVYAPTRKQSEAMASALGERLNAAAYHAGMAPEQRERVQSRFLASQLDVIVATTAFGMGVDKADVRTVVHTALPGSVEGYYQEIGRAGRDGLPSRAVLLHSFFDRKTHEFFFERDYPPVSELARLHKLLGEQPQRRSDLAFRLRWESDRSERAIDKLWAHGGADVDLDGGVTRAAARWRKPYQQQREHRQDQLERMVALAEGHACRMLQLVRHFGDQADSGQECGLCDVCAPDAVAIRTSRPPSDQECAQLALLLEHVARDGGRCAPAMGTLFRDTLEGRVERRRFEELAAALCRARLTVSVEDSFDKDGKTIAFRRLARGTDWPRGPVPDHAELARVVRLAEGHGDEDGPGGPRKRASPRASPRRRRPRTASKRKPRSSTRRRSRTGGKRKPG